MCAHTTAMDDRCDSSWAYLSSYVYHQPLPESKKSRKSAQIATPGSQNLALERQNGPNYCDRSIGVPMRARKTATEDKCASTWAYISSYIYHQPLLESQKPRNLPRMTPGSQNLALERRNGPKYCDRSIGTSACAHKTATEDKCASSWAYLSSYVYHQPLPEYKKSRKSSQNDPWEPKPCP